LSQPAFRETILPTGDSGPFGLLTSPVDSPRKTGIVILNSGLLHRVGPSRLFVTLCREFAELGFVAARIDVSGKGDTPRRRRVDATDALLEDFDACAEALRQEAAIHRIIVVGLCSGADDAYLIASKRTNVSGIIMLDGYAARTWRFFVRKFSAKLFRVNRWKRIPARMMASAAHVFNKMKADRNAPRMEDIRSFPSAAEARAQFESMSAHLESCLCVYTSAARRYYNYQGQLQQKFPSLAPSRGVREEYIPSAKHTFPLAQHRRWVVDTICEWVATFD